MSAMAVVAGLGAVSAVILGVLFLRRGGSAPAARGGTGVRPQRQQGQMIHCGPDACAVSRRTRDSWFHQGQAPSLPLEQCDRKARCQCRFYAAYDRRVAERRSGKDRREKIRMDDKPDRRSGRDRRKHGNLWRADD